MPTLALGDDKKSTGTENEPQLTENGLEKRERYFVGKKWYAEKLQR